MKSSLEKLKKFALHKSDDGRDTNKDHHHQTLVHLDALAQATQDMKDIRNYYDSLLSAAAASANSAYELSESLLEMGNCLLEKTALSDDGDCGRALPMLGKMQLDIRKYVDSYRMHVILTVTKPSESLLNELRKVEEMKLQCDEKREIYEYLLTQHRDNKGRSRSGGKGEIVTTQRLQAAREEYIEAARFCIFRVESLKRGHCRSLFTQAARHHAAQINLFRRGLESLKAVEPHIKNVAVKQHIELNGLGDVVNEDVEDINDDDGELSFDYGLYKQELLNTGTSRNSLEGDSPSMQTSGIEDLVIRRPSRNVSHSAPIFAEKVDSVEKNKDAPPTGKMFHTHVLPTPADAKNWSSRTNNNNSSFVLQPNNNNNNNNIWHSSPLETEKQRKSTEHIPRSQFATGGNIPLPPPLIPAPQSDVHNDFGYKTFKRLAFSGPLASKTPSSKPSLYKSTETQHSGLANRIPSSINVSHSLSVSPPPVYSPRISELHELPRPPPGKLGSSSMKGHSAPLGNRKREVSPSSSRIPINTGSGSASALPPPPLTVPRSFSIPSNSQRARVLHVSKLLESPLRKGRGVGEVASPPLTPILLSNVNSEVASSNSAGHIKVDAGGS